MTTNKLNIIELEPEEFYKLYGGTDGYKIGGCIPDPIEIFYPKPKPYPIEPII